MDVLRSIKEKIWTQSLPGVYKKPLKPRSVLFFIALGITNITLGIISYIPFSNENYIKIPYENNELNKIGFTISKTFEAPVFVYLCIDNFYQSHIRYSSSVSFGQLEGKATKNISSCKPIKYNDGKIVYPCGLISNSYVFDEISLINRDTNDEITINTNNIAWKSDINRIKDTNYNLNEISAPPLWPQYKEVPELNGDERFANWMRPASFPYFLKFFGRIDETLLPGNYELIVDSVTDFGEKSIYITTSSWLGLKNFFLSAALIITGSILVVASVVLWYFRNSLR
ncbi:hypothetical protein EDEG_02625 [Edhazardia aedis USNM 41457]|uniref:Cell cycle control protein n=1 Tax=Edhazardia aedis (strain USNM 41457) TaxID=1003232 RepID=J9D5A4_EDHAE|nr:hypothetical protein EDEG_02625 [Edhazardia aedis USNM 41457]|eukprot:EJW02981.1 hypothetical protein EDEG_02625 [Edhazardia aedis USNM 41457]